MPTWVVTSKLPWFILIDLDWSWFVLTLFRLWTKKLIDYSTFVLWRFAATSSVLGHDKGFGRSAGKRQCQLGSWPRSCFDSSWLILIDLDSSWLFSDFEQRNLLITRHSSFEGLLLLRASLGMTKASGGAQVKDNANLGRDLEVALIHLDWSWLILIYLDWSWLILIRLDSFQTLNKETYWLLDIRPLKVCCYFERPWAWQRLREERR